MTPLMAQYQEIKSRFPDALLFFRMGDFYELFYDDARVASAILEIALTTRNKNDPDPVPMCGVPHHAGVAYMNRLVAQGKKVAICEQLEDPSAAKGIVRRDVVRVISPGTQLDPEALDSAQLNLTHAAVLHENKITWAQCDYSTGYFWFGQCSHEEWVSLLRSVNVKEILLPEDDRGHVLSKMLTQHGISAFTQTVNSFYFDLDYSTERLKEQFQTTEVESIHNHLVSDVSLRSPVGALIKYYQNATRSLRIPLVDKLVYWSDEAVMDLDPATIASLELVSTQSAGSQSLIQFLQRTKTAVGARLLRQWLLRPLLKRSMIEKRLDGVEFFKFESDSRLELQKILGGIYDLERLLVRISTPNTNARELKNLAASLVAAGTLSAAMQNLGVRQTRLPAELVPQIDLNLVRLADSILNSLNDALPPTTREGGLFRAGVDSTLDELIELSESGAQWLARYESQEREKTKISSLKVRFNRVFGYYIDITKSNLAAVPSHYIRKQTTATGERFLTEELKSFEDKILNAERRRFELEHSMFTARCAELANFSSSIGAIARAIAQVDATLSLADIAQDRNYCRPVLSESEELRLEESRHPIVELAGGFVPNTIELHADKGNHGGKGKFLLLTGPNMGGKSTVMRQMGLSVLMAQMGSFVPASHAIVGICDRVFTRIGASDDIARGRSTFMVEMSEMSAILRNASSKSLVLLDEIGRGTSTYDGLSLAWAISEDLVQRVRCRTVFATHYHELTALEGRMPGIFNQRVGVRCDDATDEVQFLYRLEDGPAEKSYGIHVAQMAGLPTKVLQRAGEVLAFLESDAKPVAPQAVTVVASPKKTNSAKVASGAVNLNQMSFFI